MSVKISRGISSSTEANLVFCSVEMEQAFNRANQGHLLAYFYACGLIIRCCCSGLCILLVDFNNPLPVSLQKDSGQGDALPHVGFAFRPCLCSFSGEMLISQCFTFCILVHMWQLCVWSPQSCTVIVPQGKGAKKTYEARENGVLHCTQTYFRDNRLFGILQKRCGLSEIFWKWNQGCDLLFLNQCCRNARIVLKIVVWFLRF